MQDSKKNPTSSLSSKAVGEIIGLGVEAQHLAQMPQGTLPEKVVLANLDAEVAHGGPECLPEVEPLESALRPLFRTNWGLLEVREVAAAEDVIASLSFVIYLDEALADKEFGYCIGDYLPLCILARISEFHLENLCLNVLPGYGGFECAEIIFWFEGSSDEVAKRKPKIAEFLAEFIGFGVLESAIDAAITPLDRYRQTLSPAQTAQPDSDRFTSARLLRYQQLAQKNRKKH